MSGAPDPKPIRRKGNKPRRIIDPGTVANAALAHPACAACGRAGGNAHHVLPRGKGGDDVAANTVSLCGSGTARCHGAFHGSPYVVRVEPARGSTTLFAPFDERRDREWVARRIGETLLRDRPDTISYLLGKLGDAAGYAFLARVYYVESL